MASNNLKDRGIVHRNLAGEVLGKEVVCFLGRFEIPGAIEELVLVISKDRFDGVVDDLVLVVVTRLKHARNMKGSRAKHFKLDRSCTQCEFALQELSYNHNCAAA